MTRAALELQGNKGKDNSDRADKWRRIVFSLLREEDKGEEPSQEEIAMAVVVSQTSQKGNASAVDSIVSDACLLLERETYTDEERVSLGAEDVQESGDG
ncbi:hypothetical protein BHM03_00038182 [Ensete ventricosum]|nr:hypothetical protein BHM03_00038182 [Ensete ventricosum]